MRKLIVTCQCGQRMQVPRSAIGKTGMCPTCGQTTIIAADNSVPAPAGKQGQAGGMFAGRNSFWQGGGGKTPPEDAKQKFGEAVDLYYSGRYAEALAIFNALTKQFPTNPDIANGREQCLQALRRPPALALENRSAMAEGAELNAETVKRVVLEKLLTSASESVQLQAAELAARMLGMLDTGKPSEDVVEVEEVDAEVAFIDDTMPEDPDESDGNGHGEVFISDDEEPADVPREVADQ